jgi:cytochrome d ubiquinol oxidase subunit II
MSLAVVLAGVMMLALVVYALTGGADFGGGVWDLLARGPRAEAQRRLIADAIAPIWEANHVWLIVVIVVLFTAFPSAFAAITTALHIPLTLMLIGIVLRGSAFVFRAYGSQDERSQRRWSHVFAVASTVTPVMLGVTAGAVASGALPLDPQTGLVQTDFISAWLAPFPFAVGFLALALFAFLAAVYLVHEAEDDALREDFRRRALGAAVATGLFAFVALWLAGEGAPEVRHGLAVGPIALPFQLVTGLAAVAALGALWRRRWALARLAAMAQVGLVVLGWGLAQFPYVVVPDLTFTAAAAPDSVLLPVTIALGAGSVVLVPAFWYLYRVFKARG